MTDTIDAVMADEVVDQQQLAEQLLAQAKTQGIDLVGPDGLLNQITKRVLETDPEPREIFIENGRWGLLRPGPSSSASLPVVVQRVARHSRADQRPEQVAEGLQIILQPLVNLRRNAMGSPRLAGDRNDDDVVVRINMRLNPISKL